MWVLKSIGICMTSGCFYQDCYQLFLTNHFVDLPGLLTKALFISTPVVMCSHYLLTATHCFWSVKISFSYCSFISSEHTVMSEQVIASIISTVQLFTDSITSSTIVMPPFPQELISKNYVQPFSN